MKKLINESVNRFLGWKLPANFAPDAGIMFKPNANTESPVQFQYKHEPTGTNLFRAGQAEAMLIHVAKPLTDKIETLESDLQLQTKVFIAACEDLALIAEKLGIDPEDGGASPIIGSITELKAQLADSKQVANDCRIVADDAIAEAKKYQWQPIETVPNDHFPRLFRVNGFVVQGFLDVTGQLLVQPNGGLPRKMKGKPTHWMPLPSALKPLFGELVDKHFPEGIDAAIQAEGKHD